MNIIERTLKILTEEATLFSSDDGYRFMIFPEPLGNPSFHLRYKTHWEVVLQIKDFMILEVKFGDFKKNTMLPKTILKRVTKILKEEDDGMTKWELLLRLWNNNNANYKVKLSTKLPA